MKKLNLKLKGVKEMLSKVEMKKVLGGYRGQGLYTCCYDNGGSCSVCVYVSPSSTTCVTGAHLASCA